ncbi:MAG: hypothetical protein R6U08_01355, partial [Bacillota bacterium]
MAYAGFEDVGHGPEGTTEGAVWNFTTESIELSNLALFKPVTYSSQQEEYGYWASNVVDSIDNDGNLRWS